MASFSSLLLSRKVLMNLFVNLSRLVFLQNFSYFFQFPITSFSSFLCTPPKHCCITRMFFNELFHFESMKQISKVLSQEKFKGTSHQCIDIKLTICLMCHTSLCHNNKGMLWPIFCIDINTHSDRN